MKSFKNFKVNNYITLKLEEGKTNIYVNGNYFQQCKYLLLNIFPKEISHLDDIESIDEAAEQLGHSTEKEEIAYIEPEVEFWGHCSNLQVWAENNYNTCLLQSELAFNLLKALVEAGDIKSKQVLKEEIVRRINSGYLPVAFYLISEDYPKHYLNEEELPINLLEENIKLKKAIRSGIASDIKNREKESIGLLLIEELIRSYKDTEAKNLYQEIIREILRLKQKDDFNFLTGKRPRLNIFSEEELENLLYGAPIFLDIIKAEPEIDKMYKKIIIKLKTNEKKTIIKRLLFAVNYPEDNISIAEAINDIFIDIQHGYFKSSNKKKREKILREMTMKVKAELRK